MSNILRLVTLIVQSRPAAGLGLLRVRPAWIYLDLLDLLDNAHAEADRARRHRAGRPTERGQVADSRSQAPGPLGQQLALGQAVCWDILI